VSLKALGVPVACSHDLGASHHDRRHFIDKDFLLSLPDGARLLEAARATKPSPACRAVICLADTDVYEFGADFASGARSVASGATRLRVLGMLPVPLPVTLRVHPGALAGSPRSDAGDPNASPKKLTARLSDALVVERLPVPAHVSLRRAIECASARARDDVVADLVLAVCDPSSQRTEPGAFPERYRARQGWEGMHRPSSLLPAPTADFTKKKKKKAKTKTTPRRTTTRSVSEPRATFDACRKRRARLLLVVPVLTRSTIARRSRVCGSRTTRLVRHVPPPCTPRRTASRTSGLG
jgi:hypothetical protein